MPYIKLEERVEYDDAIHDLLDELRCQGSSVGHINYIISTLIWNLWAGDYTSGNNLMGVLECVKQEFYRKQLAPYEDVKEKLNGSL